MRFMYTQIESLDEWNYRTPSHFPTFLRSHTRISFKTTGLMVKIIGLLLLYHSETCKVLGHGYWKKSGEYGMDEWLEVCGCGGGGRGGGR